MKYLFSLFLVWSIHLSLFSQKILLEKDISHAYKNLKGPNTKSFGQVYFGYGLIIDPSQGSATEIKMPNSWLGTIGYRHKYKVSGFYSFGFEAGMRLSQYHIKQTDAKVFPNAINHDKEKIRLCSGSIGLYNRFNFGRRGNIIGKFIDLGGYAAYNYNTVHYTKDDISGDATPGADVYAKKRVTKNSGLDYIEPFDFGLYGRAGINKFAIRANFRLTDLFKAGYHWAELPALTIGVELSI
ncbi:MAG: outer membrane beta-barrel protein [Bacteroidales bacterium]